MKFKIELNWVMVLKNICVHILCNNNLFYQVRWWSDGKGLGLQLKRWKGEKLNPTLDMLRSWHHYDKLS
jgi:hypothetical protein